MSVQAMLQQIMANYDANRVEEGDGDWILAQLQEASHADRMALARLLVPETALPTEAPGEMVEYAMWVGNTGVLTICVVGSDADSNWLQGEKRVGTVRLPLVVATVEPAP